MVLYFIDRKLWYQKIAKNYSFFKYTIFNLLLTTLIFWASGTVKCRTKTYNVLKGIQHFNTNPVNRYFKSRMVLSWPMKLKTQWDQEHKVGNYVLIFGLAVKCRLTTHLFKVEVASASFC